MELLCSLPIEPRYADLGLLASELGLSAQKLIRPAVDSLRLRGYIVKTWRISGDGNVIALARESFQIAMAAGQEYWERVHQ